MKLVITIDTEEDNWGQYNLNSHSLQNIERIGALQQLFDRFNVKPTYLVTYPVATDKNAVSLLKGIMDGGKCEIGSHCHPWNTPPFEEERNDWNSMLCNLPAPLQQQKILTIHETIAHSFGIHPTSFRAGRWGFGDSTAQILCSTGYKVDSSVLAFQNWEDYDGPDYSNISPDIFIHTEQKGSQGGPSASLLEVPASAGFTQNNFQLCNQMWQLLEGKCMQKLHLRGILRRFGILSKFWLSPETSNTSEMIKLTTAMMHQGYRIANMFFHSTALKAGLSPFVQTKDDENHFLRRIEDYLAFTHRTGIESIKLSDVPAYIQAERRQPMPLQLN
jgi:hypothetical protein